MPYDARAIANWYIERAAEQGAELTQMQLQKLVYIAHGWNLALRHEPLIYDAVEAWQWGPVVRSLYREFREYGAEPIDRKALVLDGGSLEEREISIDDYWSAETQPTKDLLERCWDVYGKLSAAQLAALTHREGTPWHRMYEQMGQKIQPYTVIPDQLIREHYETLANARPRAESPA